MIQAIIFDFDGVLIESADIKTRAFEKLFSEFPDEVDEMVDYHLANIGISRYIKFKHFYEQIIGKSYTEEKGLELGRQFSEIVLNEIKNAPYVIGIVNFLKRHSSRYYIFIASGTPQSELIDIVNFKNLDKYFTAVYGSPMTKTEIINKILSDYSIKRKDVIFIGDAESDKVAAEDTGINFILRVTPENKALIESTKYTIEDMRQLEDKISEIEM